jgi:DNA-binding FadR family transcriptional regulator
MVGAELVEAVLSSVVVASIMGRHAFEDCVERLATAIVEAILAGDPRSAGRMMESHCDDTAALLRGLLS